MVGPYRMESLLGRGGMGEVWRATDTSHNDRTVAVKLLSDRLLGDEAFARRFRRESALAAQVVSPHIIPVHRYGEIDGRLYLEMPLIEGVDLGTLLEQHGPMDVERAVRLVEQAADALDAAHGAELIHRDVKPSNLLVTARDFVYLIDFGIATTADGTRTLSTVLGSPLYMAPERFSSESASGPSGDIYALGCVFYEMITGRRAFSGGSIVELLHAHLTTKPVPPSDVRPGVPKAIDDVVGRVLAKDVHERFPTAGEFCAALRAALYRSGARTTDTARPRLPDDAGSVDLPQVAAARPGVSGATTTDTVPGVADADLPAAPDPWRPRAPTRRSWWLGSGAAVAALVVLGLLAFWLVPVFTQGTSTSAPDGTAQVAPIQDSVVRVEGRATVCSKLVQGSGFVIAPELVMTAANAIAGSASVSVESDGAVPISLPATVIVYDADVDVAILRVPGLTARPLSMSYAELKPGTTATLLGFPRGAYQTTPVEVVQRIRLKGPNIYDEKEIVRDVYVGTATVQPGYSGAPLVTPADEVVGVAFGASMDDTKGYFLSTAQVQAASEASRSKTAAVSTGKCAAS